MLPKELIRLLVKNLTMSDFAQQAFTGDCFVSIMMAAATAESYLAEAQGQRARIRRGRATLSSRMVAWADTPSKTNGQPRRFAEFPDAAIHFYANCWTVVGRHLTAIRDISALPEVGRALRPHLPMFKKYAALRDHYEHLDERLPGRKNAHRVGGQFYGLMAGDTLTFGNRSVDVGPSSLKVLRAAVRDVQDAFKRGAIDRLAQAQPNRLRTLAWRARCCQGVVPSTKRPAGSR